MQTLENTNYTVIDLSSEYGHNEVFPYYLKLIKSILILAFLILLHLFVWA